MIFAPCNVTWEGHWLEILPLTGFHPPLTLVDPLKCCRKCCFIKNRGRGSYGRGVLLFTAQIKWQTAITWACLHLKAQHVIGQCWFFVPSLTVNVFYFFIYFFYWFTNCPGRSNVATDTMNKWCTADQCISVKEDWPLKLQYLAAGNETDVKLSLFSLLLFA